MTEPTSLSEARIAPKHDIIVRAERGRRLREREKRIKVAKAILVWLVIGGVLFTIGYVASFFVRHQ